MTTAIGDPTTIGETPAQSVVESPTTHRPPSDADRSLGRVRSDPHPSPHPTPSEPSAAKVSTPWAARRVRSEWAQLCRPTDHPAVFDPTMVADFPESARRYLTHAIARGTPLWRSVEVSMVGQIRIGSWRPFTATQVIAPPVGYIWAARARLFGFPVIGYDRLSAGVGEMRWRVLDLVPVVSVTGRDVARSAAGRLASEIALLPTASTDARWTAGRTRDIAVATWGNGEDREQVELHVGPAGELLDVLMQRWGNPDGMPFGRYPFGVTVTGERTHAGVTLPEHVRAGWWWGTNRQYDGEFFRAKITKVTFR